jgi:hypothetical protein
MQILGTEKRNPGDFGGRIQFPAHVEFFGYLRKVGFELLGIEVCATVANVWSFIGEAPLDAHEEQAEIVVLVLIGMQDVRTVLVEEPGNAGHQPFTVRAIDEKNSCVFHFPF